MHPIIILIREIWTRILKVIDIAFAEELPQDPAPRLGRPPKNARTKELEKIYETAMQELGVMEYKGPEANPRILQYFRTVSGGHTSDELSWCAAGINFVLKVAGPYEGTGSPIARKFNGWGVKLEEPQKGCVAVLWRDSVNSWKGHVTLFSSWLDEDKTQFWGLGFNQDDQVTIDLFSAEKVLSYRAPF